MTAMTRQWLRNCEIIIGKAGTGLSVKNLRIKFEIVKTTDKTPNTCNVKIYNLKFENANKIRDQYQDVIINAGYKDAVKTIFVGDIKYFYRYREGTDWIVELECGDGHYAFQNSITSVTIRKENTSQQEYEALIRNFSDHGVTAGHTKELTERPRIRGKVISAPTHEAMDSVAKAQGKQWFIQDKQVVMLGEKEVLPNQAIVINSQTGLIGSPEQGEQSVKVKCLLNNNIKIGSVIQLNNNDVQPYKIDVGKIEQDGKKKKTKQNKKKTSGHLSPDGLYKVIKLTNSGDNFGGGGEWYTEVEVIAL